MRSRLIVMLAVAFAASLVAVGSAFAAPNPLSVSAPHVIHVDPSATTYIYDMTGTLAGPADLCNVTRDGIPLIAFEVSNTFEVLFTGAVDMKHTQVSVEMNCPLSGGSFSQMTNIIGAGKTSGSQIPPDVEVLTNSDL